MPRPQSGFGITKPAADPPEGRLREEVAGGEVGAHDARELGLVVEDQVVLLQFRGRETVQAFSHWREMEAAG